MTEHNRHSEAPGKAGRTSERLLAKTLGARAQPASGALEGAKGDIELPAFLLEAKSTTQKSMALQLQWLAKIAGEARSIGKPPAVAITFTRPDGHPLLDGEWVAIPLYTFKELLT